MRILELNGPTFVDLADALDETDHPEQERIRIKRNGQGTKTRYAIRPRGRVDSDLRKKLSFEAEELSDLAEFGGRPIDLGDEPIPF